jgi:hypothetical protein
MAEWITEPPPTRNGWCLASHCRQQHGPLAQEWLWPSPTYSLEVAFDTARETGTHSDDIETGLNYTEDDAEEEHESMFHKGGKSDWRAAGRPMKGKRSQ